MNSRVPWSIRGIDERTREAARGAARRSGLSVSEWLNDLITESTVRNHAGRSRHEYDDRDEDTIVDAIQRLTGRIRAMDANSHRALSAFQQRIDEIEERLVGRRNLDRRGVAKSRSLKDVASIIDELTREIDDAGDPVRSTIESLHEHDDIHAERRGGGDDRLLEAIRSLESRISMLSSKIRSPGTDEPAAKLETIKDQLNAMLAKSPERPVGRGEDLNATLRSLEAHIDQAESRLNAATQPAADEEVREHWLEERIGEITDGIAAKRPSGPASSEIVSAIDEISDRQRKLDELPDVAALAKEQRQASASLNALRADIAALTDKVSASGQESAGDREASTKLAERIDALDRRIPDGEQIESRLDAISARIDSFLGNSSPASAIDALQERFSTLLERIDAISASQLNPNDLLDGIKSEIAEIRHEIADQAQPKIDHIEEQIAELANRLDTTIQSGPEGDTLAELEAQIAHLASEIEQAMPRSATLKQVEENLARLQDHLSDNRQESVEAARSAAREAVRDIVDKPGDSELVRALKQDLENIRTAAGEADQRSQQSLGSVHGMLARVVERLTRLENESDKSASANTPDHSEATQSRDSHSESSRAEPGPAAGGLAGGATRDDDGQMSGIATDKPDLAALRELARSTADAQPGKKGDRRADYIAAARRAAHAAAIEASRTVEDQSEEETPGTFARIGMAIRDRKRPLLVAAAALVLAISAIHMFGEIDVDVVDNSQDTFEIGSNTNGSGAPIGHNFAAAGVRGMATKTPVGTSALMTPPPDIRAAMAFSKTRPVDGRFDMSPNLPSPVTFDVSPAALDKPAHIAAAAVESDSGSVNAPSKLRQAAEIGDPAAALEIAIRYAEGNGVSRDLGKAAAWYDRAARAGIAVAQYRLGSLFERGEGVEEDRSAAVGWYRRAADQGNIGAMHNLAVMMSEGVEGAPDHKSAFEWFFTAANHGVVDSQFNLAVVFARGLGKDKDLAEAYKWFAIAAASGDIDARARRDQVEKALSPDDLAKARAAVKAWRVTTPVEHANIVVAPSDEWDSAPVGISDTDRRSLVTKIQALLTEQGYDPGPVDGFEGPKTREAVRAFQRNFGLAATGIISGDLATALVSLST